MDDSPDPEPRTAEPGVTLPLAGRLSIGYVAALGVTASCISVVIGILLLVSHRLGDATQVTASGYAAVIGSLGMVFSGIVGILLSLALFAVKAKLEQRAPLEGAAASPPTAAPTGSTGGSAGGGGS